MDGNDVKPFFVVGDREATPVKVTPEFKEVRYWCCLKVIDRQVLLSIILWSEDCITTYGVPRHVKEDKGDKQLDLIRALHGLGEKSIPCENS